MPVKQASIGSGIPIVPTYLGVDPGVNGGLAVVRGGDLRAASMPESMPDLWYLFMNEFGGEAAPCFACLEKVNGYVGDGGNPGSAMFKFGQSAGALEMMLSHPLNGVPFEKVTPQRWQKALGIPSKKRHTSKVRHVITKGKRKGQVVQKAVGGETGAQFKERLRQHAQRLFPSHRISLAVADAVLLAVYCQRWREGRL